MHSLYFDGEASLFPANRTCKELHMTPTSYRTCVILNTQQIQNIGHDKLLFMKIYDIMWVEWAFT